ncbi:MAG: T9SS type A sorting domain-containing protein [Armatimonadetes bacterium]|nr:T9SS type A sorting domain-containing protein [Armatimonadota bacterium]
MSLPTQQFTASTMLSFRSSFCLLLLASFGGSVAAAQYVNPLTLPAQQADMPEWARLLYQPPINALQLDSAYDAYYRTHQFHKNNWTKFYRRWRRAAMPFMQPDGTVARLTADAIEAMRRPKNIESTQLQRALTPWKNLTMETFWEKGSRADQAPCPWQANVYGFDISRSNPSVLYCGTEPGAIFKTVDKGKTWKQIGAEYVLQTEAISIHPTNPDIVYLGAPGAIRRTADGGTTWATLFTLKDLWLNDIEVHPSAPNMIFAAGNLGLFRSSNAGQDWTQVLTDGVSDLEINTADPNQLYVLKYNPDTKFYEAWKSTDMGGSFTPRTNGWPTGLTGGEGRMAVTPADAKRIYAVLLTNAGPRVMKSSNSGESWTIAAIGESDSLQMNNGQGYYDLSIVASPQNADHLIVATTSAYRSTNGGGKFDAVGGYTGPFPIHPDIQEMRALAGETWIATDGGFTLSTDFFADTKNAEARINGLNGSDFWGFDMGWNEDVMVGGRYHNGNTAIHENYGGRFLRMDGGEAATGYVNPGNPRRTYYSDIGGYVIPPAFDQRATHFPTGKWPNESYWLMEYSEMAWDPRCYSIVWIGSGNTIWRSMSNGANYDSIFASPDTEAAMEHIEISRSNPDVIYVTERSNARTDGAIWRTSDGGKNWSKLTNPPATTGRDRRVSNIALSGTDPNVLWVAYRYAATGRTIFKTSDGGQTWTNLTTAAMQDYNISDIVHQLGTDDGVYIACDGGKIFYRNNALNNWEPVGTGLPVSHYTRGLKIFYRDGKLRSGSNMGIWETALFEPSKPLAQPMADKLISTCPRDTFYFEDYSALNHTGATWQWEFPGAAWVSSRSARNPKVVFGKPGIYSVSLTVKNPAGTSTRAINQMIEVRESQCDLDSVAGLALDLGSRSDAAMLDPIPELSGATGLTVAAWVKLDTIQKSFSQLLTNWGSNVGFGFGFAFMGYRANTNLTFYWRGVPYQLTSPFNLDTAKWIHVAITIQPDQATLYRNGEAWTYKGDFTGFNLSETLFELGGGLPGQGGNFQGEIDELKIYNRTLSQAEIREMMHLIPRNTSQNGAQGLTAYYQFNERGQERVFNRVGGTHAVNAGGIRVESTAPVAVGASQRLSISNGGQQKFDTAGLSLYLPPTGGTYPDGEVAVYHLAASPDSLPNGTERFANNYWIVRNWGKNNQFTLDSLLFSQFADVSKGDRPNNFRLWSRGVDDHSNGWQPNPSMAQRADPDRETVTFGGDGVTSALQLIVSGNGQSALGVEEKEEESEGTDISIHPNPASQFVELRWKPDATGQESVIRVTDSEGRQVLLQPTLHGQQSATLNLQSLPAGTYFVKVNGRKGIVVKK